MPRRKSPPDRRSRSGPNIPESQRSTVAIKIRVLPSVDAELRERAAASGMTVSAVVSALVMASAASATATRGDTRRRAAPRE